jgi:putative flippase GtrA
MSNAHLSAPARQLLRLIRFGCIGALASAVYAVGVVALVDGLGLAATVSSALAYLIAVPVSFLGQKHVTFGSGGEVRRELPRFLAVQVVNLAAAALIMQLVTGALGMSHLIGMLAVIAVIPALTYVLLSILVFEAGRR